MRLLRSLAVASIAAAAAAGSAAEPRDRRPEFTTRTDEVVALGQVLSGSASAAAAPGETAGQEAVVALGETAPVSSVAVDVDVRFDHPYGLARVVVVDRGGTEHLVYETYPALEDGDRVQARGVCEETCQVAALAPAELRVQAVGARVAVHRLLLGHASLPDDPGARRRSQAAYKIGRINAAFAARRVAWRADDTTMSELSYQQKRRMFLDWEDHLFLPNLQGFELYRDGTFDVLGAAAAATGSIPELWDDMGCGAPTYAFDWRSRHGRNYMTPVRYQGGCGSCWAFAAVGAAEARINTFYNQLLNVDLAEQDSVCYTGNHEYEGTCVFVPVYAMYADGCNGGLPQGTNEVLTSVGLPLETDMPYFASHDGAMCSAARAAAAGKPRWMALGIEGGTRDTGSIKNMLTRGPVTVCIGAWDHCIVIAGWEDFSCGTRWILKNSWGSWWGEGGYARARLDLGDIPWSGCGFSDVTLRGPTQMVPVGATPPPVVCEDRDGDRWCNWGTGPKPSTCAGLSCYTQGDPDDLTCTAPTCAAVGSGKCGTFSNACGGVYCGCPSTRPVCVNGTCSGCPSGYKDCGDGRCIRSTLYCP